MPKNLDQITAAAAEDVEITRMRVALQTLLDRERQALQAAAHVCVTGGDPDPDVAWDRNHHRLRSSRTRCSASVSTSRSTRTRQPPSSISIMPTFARSLAGDGRGCPTTVDSGAGVEVISTGTRTGAA